MTDPQTLARINQLEQAQRCWRRFALGALAALLFVLAVGSVTAVFQQQRISTAQERAEQAIREAQEQRLQVQRMLYYSQIALAERELAANSQRPDRKP